MGVGYGYPQDKLYIDAAPEIAKLQAQNAKLTAIALAAHNLAAAFNDRCDMKQEYVELENALNDADYLIEELQNEATRRCMETHGCENLVKCKGCDDMYCVDELEDGYCDDCLIEYHGLVKELPDAADS